MIIVGLSHKTAPIEIREKFFLNPLQQDLLLSELKNHPLISEAFVLSTCNRIEVYLKRESPTINSSFVVALIAKIKKLNFDFNVESYLYSYENTAALEHLLRVTSGLDSLVLGEKQILGQVKRSVMRAQELGTLSRYFNILTNIAIRTGKKAQHETAICHGGSSISWAAAKPTSVPRPPRRANLISPMPGFRTLTATNRSPNTCATSTTGLRALTTA